MHNRLCYTKLEDPLCIKCKEKKIKGGGCEEKMNNLKLKLLSSDSVCETKFRSRVTSSDA